MQPVFPATLLRLPNGGFAIAPEEPLAFDVDLEFPVASEEQRAQVAQRLGANGSRFEDVIRFAEERDPIVGAALRKEALALKTRFAMMAEEMRVDLPVTGELTLSSEQQEKVMRLRAAFPSLDESIIQNVLGVEDWDEERAMTLISSQPGLNG
jgi:hypothetical protein